MKARVARCVWMLTFGWVVTLPLLFAMPLMRMTGGYGYADACGTMLSYISDPVSWGDWELTYADEHQSNTVASHLIWYFVFLTPTFLMFLVVSIALTYTFIGFFMGLVMAQLSFQLFAPSGMHVVASSKNPVVG